MGVTLKYNDKLKLNIYKFELSYTSRLHQIFDNHKPLPPVRGAGFQNLIQILLKMQFFLI